MDYSLPARKLLLADVSAYRIIRRANGQPLLEGVLRSPADAEGPAAEGRAGGAPVAVGRVAEGGLYLDDGSAAVEIVPAKGGSPPLVGSYVQVIGALCTRPASPPFIKVHKIVGIAAGPNREALMTFELTQGHLLCRLKVTSARAKLVDLTAADLNRESPCGTWR
ncbi:unnamed protein product [Closterium sp. Naga37s-1]|nr:unnamed protein product [Closterium sp. Naga37s-1]